MFGLQTNKTQIPPMEYQTEMKRTLKNILLLSCMTFAALALPGYQSSNLFGQDEKKPEEPAAEAPASRKTKRGCWGDERAGDS